MSRSSRPMSTKVHARCQNPASWIVGSGRARRRLCERHFRHWRADHPREAAFWQIFGIDKQCQVRG